MDSLGKPPAGIFDGNVAWDGSYTECLNSVNPTKQFATNYYSLVSMGEIASPGVPPALRYGLCAPNQCNTNDVVEILNFGNLLNDKVPIKQLSFNSSFFLVISY